MKARLFSLLGELANARPYISFGEVVAALRGDELAQKPALLREYLSEAMDKKVVHDAGRGWYSSLEEPAVLDPEATAPLRALLTKRFPFLPHYVWSTQQVNPWMHHLLGKFVRFVFVESDGAADVAEFLRKEGLAVIVNPTAKSAKEFIPGERSVVVRGIRRAFDPGIEPRVETVLVDLMLENARLHLMDEGERQEMSCKLLTTNRIELAALLGRLRDHKRSLVDLIGDVRQPIIAEKSKISGKMGQPANPE